MFLNDIYLPDEELCMAEIFQSAGYRTGYLGKWHLDGHGRSNNVAPERRQGFMYWKAAECSHNYNHMLYYENESPEKKYWDGYSPYALSRDAQDYLIKRAADGQSFLLFISFATPHFPHHSAPEEYRKLYPPSRVKLRPNVPEELYEEVFREIQGYYAHCTATDRAIGEIVDKIRELGLFQNTVLVFTSDHGEMMGSHGRLPYRKQLPWDESVRVPFLISYPGIGGNRGSEVHAPLTTPDILPSLLSLCNIPVPGSVEGEDLSALIRLPDTVKDRSALFMNVCPFGANFEDPEYRGIRTSRYTYVRSPEGPVMLFDNREDPWQMNNLVNLPEYAELRTRLDQNLQSELKEINDENFRSRDYYLEKFEFTLERNTINFWDLHDGKGKVQSPAQMSLRQKTEPSPVFDRAQLSDKSKHNSQ
jgi:arylsulfatase A-like enzyme